jgi:antitoxin MazE
MHSSISRWGNSLAVRLPSEQIKMLGLREGAAVEVSLTAAGEIRIAPLRPFDKPAFVKRLRAAQARMPESEPVLDTLRGAARY